MDSIYLYALDLSMNNTGIVIFDLETKEPIHISSIATNDKDSHGIRLYNIGEEFIKLRDTYKPSVVAIERGFNRFNTATQVIYRVHGLTNYLFYDVVQVYYPPKTVKEAIVRGDASKKLVRQIIERHYPNVEFEDEDQSDAFAVGLTWMIKNKEIKWEKGLKVKK